MNYIKALSKFEIVNKDGQAVSFTPNKFQQKYLDEMTNRDIILKVRQVGFSSLILGIFTLDFLLNDNSRSVCISHDAQSAQKLLDRVKYFIRSAEEQGLLINLKYNSRNELVNAEKNSSFYIGQAGSKSFGRGDTLNNLHLSEFAFYDDPERMLSSVLQAVVPTGRVVIETTANGMNYFKNFWDKSKAGETNFKAHFFDNSFYSKEFLDQKRKELEEQQFKQEYPSTDTEAFISSGRPFFDREALRFYLDNTKEPIETFNTFYDLQI
jgi:hypothetical protein